MCSIALCEETAWVLGAKGRCNNVTQLCECPAGYTGFGPFSRLNDCHMNILLFRILYTVAFSSSILGIPVMLCFAVRIKNRLAEAREILEATRSIASSVTADESSGSSSERKSTGQFPRRGYAKGSGSRSENSTAAKLKQYRSGLLTICLFIGYLLFVIPQQAVLAFSGDDLDFNVPAYASVTFGMAWACFWLAGYNMLYAFWNSLPDWKYLCKILQIKSPIVTCSRSK